MEDKILHKPVLVDEVIRSLRLKRRCKVLDATVGCGGHASFILDIIRPDGLLIGIDRDASSLKIAKERTKKFSSICKMVHANFCDLDSVLLSLGVDKIDAALFDFGVSSFQIDDPGRGFSFQHDGFLDMRMDLSGSLRAYDIVNRYRKEELENVIYDFGGERYSRKIARFILERRRNKPIESTKDLSELIKKAVGARYRGQKIHPATRTFQALRIAVNSELKNIDSALQKIVKLMQRGGRISAISFHSLEDRIAKVRFKEFEKCGLGRILTKKPISASDSEIMENPRSRSAKLRVFESTG
ncbi:MAG: 16S rRNA (cytosine(1402)-N(4))-methyltransferase RsmH [Candidatus Omnitrophota bacterium]